ncbi:hypothetical protein G6F22_015713 [Rhizopus arrhizus]|nr:hypothetical protein G6F22_015713 [Rhizopus arrhizus]
MYNLPRPLFTFRPVFPGVLPAGKHAAQHAVAQDGMVKQGRQRMQQRQNDDRPGHGIVQPADEPALLVVDGDQRGHVEQAEEGERRALGPPEQESQHDLRGQQQVQQAVYTRTSHSQPAAGGGRQAPALTEAPDDAQHEDRRERQAE